jgi:glycosyltransferase involved in cell wall biosynthesis
MRLLYCSRDYTTHDLRFVRAFAAAGIEVVYVRFEDDGVPYIAEPLPAGVTAVRWETRGEPWPLPEAVRQSIQRFAEVVTETRPDVIHAGPVHGFGFIAARARAAPTVVVSWGSDLLVEAHRDEWHREAARAALQGCDALLCDSEAVLEAARGLSGGVLPPHLCVPWGPEVPRHPEDVQVRPAVRREKGWQRCIVVISARAWHPGYRIPELVDAFAAAAARNGRLRLALASAGADGPEVQRRISAHGIGHLIHQPGVLPATQLHRLFSAADIYVSLVPSDGTSVSLLEAMSHGLPVVVARNAGNAQWVEDGTTGYLVEGDARTWSEHILDLAADRVGARRVGQAGRRAVERRADWSQNSARIVEFYREIASRGRLAAEAGTQ